MDRPTQTRLTFYKGDVGLEGSFADLLVLWPAVEWPEGFPADDWKRRLEESEARSLVTACPAIAERLRAVGATIDDPESRVSEGEGYVFITEPVISLDGASAFVHEFHVGNPESMGSFVFLRKSDQGAWLIGDVIAVWMSRVATPEEQAPSDGQTP